MNFYNRFKYYIKKQSTHSYELLSMNTIKKTSRILSIQFKNYFQGHELTANQKLINTIVERIIKNEKSHRLYAGKKDKDIMEVNEKIYKYESYRTHNVKLVPVSENEIDLYIENIKLGQIPDNYTKDVKHYLQTSVLMAFTYIKGGPYKYFDKEKLQVLEGEEPYDLSIYIQFS